MQAERAKHNAAWKAAAAAAQKANNQLPASSFAPVFHAPPIAHRSPILHGALSYGAPNSHGPPISHVNHIGHRGHVQGVHIADTPEVQAAKARFIAAYAATAARDKSASLSVAPIQHVHAQHAHAQHAHAQNAHAQHAHVAPHITPITNHGLFDDGQTWPRAEPYVHVDIPAPPYIQNDPLLSPNIHHHHDTPSLNHHPVGHHSVGHHPVGQNPVGQNPVGHLAGVCHNWKGDVVLC